MPSVISDMGRRSVSRVRRNTPLPTDRSLTPERTTTSERFLLMATVILFPLQNHLPAIAGASILFLLFAVLLGYTILYRSQALATMARRPVFLSAFVLLAVAFLIESGHPDAAYILIFQMGQMIIGAIVIAVICRDEAALQMVAYGYLIAGVWMSLLLLFTSYSTLSGATAMSFQEAQNIRVQAFEEKTLEANLNFMGFVAAQGTVVALVLAITSRSFQRCLFFLGLAVLCFVATFLPMSRTAALIVVLTSAVILLISRVNRIRLLMIAILLGVTLLAAVPGVVFSRLTFTTETNLRGKQESRAHLYATALKLLPEYFLTGVGAGNYWNSWGVRKGFTQQSTGQVKTYTGLQRPKGPKGPHSWYFAVTIYWGLAGLLALIVFVYQAYRCLPRQCGASPLSLCILGIVLSVFLLMFVSHTLNAKGVSLALGLLAAARYWIWPEGMVLPQPWGYRRIVTSVNPAGAFEKT